MCFGAISNNPNIATNTPVLPSGVNNNDSSDDSAPNADTLIAVGGCCVPADGVNRCSVGFYGGVVLIIGGIDAVVEGSANGMPGMVSFGIGCIVTGVVCMALVVRLNQCRIPY